MQASIAAGVAILELDVALTSDGAVVLLHDRTLDRTTTGTGPVAAATLGELRGLRLKDRSGQVTDQPLPTLAEALTLARGRAVVSIDFKPASRPSDPTYQADMRALVTAAARVVQSAGATRQVTLIVYSAADAALVQDVAPWATQSISADNAAELAAYRSAGVEPEGALVFAGVLRDPAVLPEPVADRRLATIVGTLGAPGRRLDDVFAADGDLSDYAGLVRGGAEVIATDAAIAAQVALVAALGPAPLERARTCLLAQELAVEPQIAPTHDPAPAPDRPQPRADGTLWFAASATLVVSGSAFREGSAFARRGSLLPPYDTAETVRRLALALEATGARRLVSLGDSFHDVTAGQRMAVSVRNQLLEALAGRTCVWVEGNHDPLLPGWLPGMRLETLEIEGWTLRHEPSPADRSVARSLGTCTLARGSRVGSGRHVRRRCFAVSDTRIIMPAFGAFTGGLNLCDPAFAAHFAAPPDALVLGRDRLHRIGLGQLLPD